MLPVERRRHTLRLIQNGTIPAEQQSEVLSLLFGCWDDLVGSDAGGMTKDDIVFLRCENLSWDPPVLSFKIVRHGGVLEGSKRGDVQAWDVDVTQATATFAVAGRRQLRPNDGRLDVNAVAYEIAAIVIEFRDDRRVVRSGSKRIRILIGKVILRTSKQTTAGRRRRFTKRLEGLLAPNGWRRQAAGSHLAFERHKV
jgi:hypothetical protein